MYFFWKKCWKYIFALLAKFLLKKEQIACVYEREIERVRANKENKKRSRFKRRSLPTFLCSESHFKEIFILQPKCLRDLEWSSLSLSHFSLFLPLSLHLPLGNSDLFQNFCYFFRFFRKSFFRKSDQNLRFSPKNFVNKKKVISYLLLCKLHLKYSKTLEKNLFWKMIYQIANYSKNTSTNFWRGAVIFGLFS